MKKAIIILTIFILCSCSVKNDNSLTIDSNGKVDYSVIIAFDKELLSGLNNMDVIDGSVEEYVTSNIKDSYLSSFKKEEYKEGQYIGNKYTQTIDDIDSVSSDELNIIYLSDNKDKVSKEKLFNKDGNVYSANFVYNLKNKYNYKDVSFINTFTVNLPTKALKSNADKVSNNGHSLTWNIVNREERNMMLSFRLNNNYAIVSIVSIVVDIVILISILIISKRRKAV